MKIKDKCYIPFGAAIFAVEVSEMQLRHWLFREQIRLDAVDERPDETSHRRFSALDLVRIGIVARLVAYGQTADHASKIVEEMLEHDFRGEGDKLIVALQTAKLTICTAEAKWGGDKKLYSFGYGSQKPPLTILSRFDTQLTIDVGRVIEKIRKRLTGPLEKFMF